MKNSISIFLALALCTCSGLISAQTLQIKIPKLGKTLTSEQVVNYLASDYLQGRAPGTKGDTLAVKFIEGQFKKLGLETSLQSFGIKKDSCITFNVIGILRGSGDKYIVVGAHYDHLGYGGPKSGSRRPDTVAVHNGADDNASGVAAILHLAKKYALGRQPEMGIVFVAFGAEEKGIIGSKEFVENLPVGREKITAMFNFDMVGYLRGGALTLGGTGTAKELDSLIDTAVNFYNNSYSYFKNTQIKSKARTSIRVKKSKEGVGPSDHSAFYAKNIPVAYFSTGATLDYHTPEDDAYKLNYSGIDSVANFAAVLLNCIAEQPSITFTEAGSASAAPMRASFKVTLGLMPDFTGQVENGLRADIVIKGKPAYNAGLKNGDIIVKINDNFVTDIESYMKCLGTLNAGETAKIKVKRGDQELLFDVKL